MLPENLVTHLQNISKSNTMKLIDRLQSAITEEEVFFSFEFFPPSTDAGLQALYEIPRHGILYSQFYLSGILESIG